MNNKILIDEQVKEIETKYNISNDENKLYEFLRRYPYHKSFDKIKKIYSTDELDSITVEKLEHFQTEMEEFSFAILKNILQLESTIKNHICLFIKNNKLNEKIDSQLFHSLKKSHGKYKSDLQGEFSDIYKNDTYKVIFRLTMGDVNNIIKLFYKDNINEVIEIINKYSIYTLSEKQYNNSFKVNTIKKYIVLSEERAKSIFLKANKKNIEDAFIENQIKNLLIENIYQVVIQDKNTRLDDLIKTSDSTKLFISVFKETKNYQLIRDSNFPSRMEYIIKFIKREYDQDSDFNKKKVVKQRLLKLQCFNTTVNLILEILNDILYNDYIITKSTEIPESTEITKIPESANFLKDNHISNIDKYLVDNSSDFLESDVLDEIREASQKDILVNNLSVIKGFRDAISHGHQFLEEFNYTRKENGKNKFIPGFEIKKSFVIGLSKKISNAECSAIEKQVENYISYQKKKL